MNIFKITTLRKNTLIVLFVSVLLSCISCRPERFIIEEYTPISNGVFRVETDYPYYYVVYRYGKMKAASTIMVRQQTVWEHNFTTQAGDTLLLEVHTLTSNVPGTKIKADIILDGKTVQAQETVSECVDGDCFQAKPLDLSMFAVTK
jgi:hypothetical protein